MTMFKYWENAYVKMCGRYPFNYVEKARLKGLIKKYGDVFTVEYKSGEERLFRLGQRGPIGTYQVNSPEMLITFTTTSPFSILYDKYYDFKRRSEWYPQRFEFSCQYNFERAECEFCESKITIDKIIWDKSKRRFYPKFVILDEFNNVYDLYDYV